MSSMANPCLGLLCLCCCHQTCRGLLEGPKLWWLQLLGAGVVLCQRSWSGFSQQGRGQALSSGCEAGLGMVDPALAGIQSTDREQGTH